MFMNFPQKNPGGVMDFNWRTCAYLCANRFGPLHDALGLEYRLVGHEAVQPHRPPSRFAQERRQPDPSELNYHPPPSYESYLKTDFLKRGYYPDFFPSHGRGLQCNPTIGRKPSTDTDFNFSARRLLKELEDTGLVL